MANNGILICEAHVRDYILRRCAEMRTGWECTRVAGQVLEDLNAQLRTRIDKAIHAHPSVGKTFKELR